MTIRERSMHAMHIATVIAAIVAIAATEAALLAIAAAVAVSPVKRTVNAISDEQTALTARRSHHTTMSYLPIKQVDAKCIVQTPNIARTHNTANSSCTSTIC